MKFRYMGLILSCCLALASFVGCGSKSSESKQTDSSDMTAPESSTTPSEPPQENPPEEVQTDPAPISQTKPDGSSDIHVTIQSVEISTADLKNQNYTVPVYISLDENSGISYFEFGANYDERCSAVEDPDNENIRFDVTCSINDTDHFLWAAWASADTKAKGGNLMLLDVTLPEDAAPGDFYPITYASQSLIGQFHVWQSLKTDYTLNGFVSWTDGGITVTE